MKTGYLLYKKNLGVRDKALSVKSLPSKHEKCLNPNAKARLGSMVLTREADMRAPRLTGQSVRLVSELHILASGKLTFSERLCLQK